jgi:hypothetical protein
VIKLKPRVYRHDEWLLAAAFIVGFVIGAFGGWLP